MVKSKILASLVNKNAIVTIFQRAYIKKIGILTNEKTT